MTNKKDKHIESLQNFIEQLPNNCSSRTGRIDRQPSIADQ